MFTLFRFVRGDAQPAQCSGHPRERQAVVVGTADELRRGRLVVRVPQSDVPVMVVGTRRGVFAFSDSCPHADASLRGGGVAGTTITCPRHARRYSLKSGRCVSALGSAPRLRRWRVWVDDNKVWIGEELT